jgi:(2Fe-2S) ferredoxin
VTDVKDPPSYFRLHVFVCTNRRPDDNPTDSCGRHDAEELWDYLKKQAKGVGVTDVRVNKAGCLDRCGVGPVLVVYPEGVWYGYRTRHDIDEILDTHLVKGGRVPRLLLQPDDTAETLALRSA